MDVDVIVVVTVVVTLVVTLVVVVAVAVVFVDTECIILIFVRLCSKQLLQIFS